MGSCRRSCRALLEDGNGADVVDEPAPGAHVVDEPSEAAPAAEAPDDNVVAARVLAAAKASRNKGSKEKDLGPLFHG